MKKNVVAPSVGESITEVSILKWAKQHGQAVKNGDLLLEIESDKATVEIVAEANGVLQILKQAGERIPVGETIGVIDDSLSATASAGPSAPPPAPPGGPSSGPPAPPGAAPSAPPPAPPASPSAKAPSAPPPAPGAGPSVPPPIPNAAPTAAVVSAPPAPPAPAAGLSPSVRRAAVQHHVDTNQVNGTGKDGRVTKGDVMKVVEGGGSAPAAAASYGSPSTPPVSVASAPAPTPSAAPTAPTPAKVDRPGDRRVPLSMLRQRIAERLVQAQHTAAILTTFNEVDLTAVMKIRNEHKDAFKAKHGVGLSFMSFFAKAVIASLKHVPEVNASIDGRDTVYHDYYDIGIAVGTERGLVVPVVRGADQLDFVGMEKKIGELAIKGRDGKLSIADLTGGTFTISNGGTYGSLLSTPILNPPQSGILGMHKIMDRPVAMNGQVVIRPMMYLALSYDHRLIDGKGAVTFLVHLKEVLENPEKLAFTY